MLTALIMAGGKGTRFWPMSTEEKPKQFLKLIDEHTMIQMTVNRIKSIIPIERIFVCTGKIYVDLVKAQLPELPQRNIIVEPEGRNTAPCIALSAFLIKKYYEDATMLVLPSDHLIEDEVTFRNIIKFSDDFIKGNNEAIITLGIAPTRPETEYGYIRCGSEAQNINNHYIINVEAFVEKPSKKVAEQYLKEGNYLWNAGMFLWSVDNIINKIKKYSTSTYKALNKINELSEKKLQKFIDENYNKTEEISIDYAVLEKSKDIYVVPSDLGWDDIGSWAALDRYREKDENNNIIGRNVKTIESKHNIVINQEKKFIMIGIENIVSLETDEAIFIVNKDYIDNLREYKDCILEG